MKPVPKKSRVSKQGTAAQLTSAKAVWVQKPWESKRAELCSRARTRCLGWVNSNHSNSCSRKLINNLWEEACYPIPELTGSLSSPAAFARLRSQKPVFRKDGECDVSLSAKPHNKGLTSKCCHSCSKNQHPHILSSVIWQREQELSAAQPGQGEGSGSQGCNQTPSPSCSPSPAGLGHSCLLKAPTSLIRKQGQESGLRAPSCAGQRWDPAPLQRRHLIPKGQPDLSHGVSIQRLICQGWNYLAPLTGRPSLHKYLLPGWL